MGFDLTRFEAAEFRPRTQRVPVPALAAFFSPGDEPVWEVRGLTSAELFAANEAKARQAQLQTVVDAITASGERAQAVRKALGLAGDVPGEVVRRMEMLVSGSVAPRIELSVAVKLAETFPIEFILITNAITELTGQGFDLAKPVAASQTITPSTPA